MNWQELHTRQQGSEHFPQNGIRPPNAMHCELSHGAPPAKAVPWLWGASQILRGRSSRPVIKDMAEWSATTTAVNPILNPILSPLKSDPPLWS
jgi:hypothetical protein